MKKTQLLIFTIFSLTALSFTYTLGDSSEMNLTPPNSGGPAINGNGDKTGSPISSGTCATCHGGGNFAPILSVFITDNFGNQVTEYVGGENYIIEYAVLNTIGSPAAFGVQSVFLSPSAGNPEAGVLTSTITLGSQIVTSGGYNYYEHSTPSTIGIFQVSWTAPVAGFGDVNIYTTGVAVDGTGGTSGDEATLPNVFVFPEACVATTGTDVQTACGSFDWIDGTTYAASNNTATFTINNGAANGCDSIVTLDLTINTVNTAVSSAGITVTADQSGAGYQWIDCGNGNTVIMGETNQAYTATANGDYAVIVTENGCSDTSACTTISQVGIVENSFGASLLIAPNPTSGNFTIDLGNEYDEVTIAMTNLNGKLIQSRDYNNCELVHLNIDQPAGVYLLMITAEDKKAVIRMVKK